MSDLAKHKDTRRKLLDAGIELFSEQGYAATGLKQILNKVGVPKGSFYNYFDSKEAFGAAILDEYVDFLVARVKFYVSDETTPAIERIRLIHLEIIEFVEASNALNGCLVGRMAAEIGHGLSGVSKSLTGGFERWIAGYVQLLEEAQAVGDVRRDVSAKDLADIFWNQWQGSLLQMRIYGSTRPLKTGLSILLDQMFRP